MARQRSIFEDLLADASSTDVRAREAALLLKNLLARLDADAAADRPQFRGVVSDAERDALRELLAGVGPSRSSPPDPPVEAVVEPPEPTQPTETAEPPEEDAAETTLPAVDLNLDALRPEVAPPPEWVLCLDFGTAKSKAFAATDDEEDPELEPLAIGKDDEDRDESVYEVSSCVWIDDDGRLFVGSEAVNRGMNYGAEPATRRPLDSLKQEISQVDPADGSAELQRKLPEEVDPTSTLTYADAVTIYLAYLTDLATGAVARRLGTRYVRRRFTVPCWQTTQRGWAAELLGRSLLRAQLLADTFRDRWREGIPVEQVAYAVQAAAAHDGELMPLAAIESDDVTDWPAGLSKRWGQLPRACGGSALRATSCSWWMSGPGRPTCRCSGSCSMEHPIARFRSWTGTRESGRRGIRWTDCWSRRCCGRQASASTRPESARAAACAARGYVR